MQKKIDILKQQQRCKEWLQDRPSLSHSALEREAGLTARSLYTFLRKEFTMSEENFEKLVTTLKRYGWKQ